MALRTEFSFNLPKGLIDADGDLHQRGVMRMATARDEIEPLRDPRVKDSEDPLVTLIILARVVTQLGDLSAVSVRDIENLFALDLAYLQDLYSVINFGTNEEIAAFLSESSGQEPLSEESQPVDASDGEANVEAATGASRRRGGAMIEEVAP